MMQTVVMNAENLNKYEVKLFLDFVLLVYLLRQRLG
jgi:hypothetical protein